MKQSRISNQRFRSLSDLINLLPCAAILLDSRNNISVVNRAFEHLSGFQSSELLEKAFPYPVLDESATAVRAIISERNHQNLAVLLKCKNRPALKCRVNLTVCKDKARTAYKILTFGYTNKDSGTYRLQDLNIRQEMLFLETVPVPFILIDKQNARLIATNTTFKNLVDKSWKSYSRKTLFDLYDFDSNDENQPEYGGVIDKRAIKLILTGFKQNKSVYTVKTWRTSTGRELVIGIVDTVKLNKSSSTDITTEKIAEEKNVSLLVQRQAILDSLQDPAWLKDKDLKFIAVNRALLQVSNSREEDLIGKNESDILPGDAGLRFLEDDRKVLQSGESLTVEDYLGESIWMKTTKTPLLDSSGKVIGLTGICLNISQRKLDEIELQRVNRILRVIRNIERIITQQKDPQKMLDNICKILTGLEEYLACWIIRLDDDNRILSVAQKNPVKDFDKLSNCLKTGENVKCFEKVLESNAVTILDNKDRLYCECAVANELCLDYKIVAVPIKHDCKNQGILSLLIKRNVIVNDEEKQILKELADDCGLALYNIKLAEERLKSDMELKLSEERFRVITEVAKDMIYRLNLIPQVKIDYISPACRNILGYTQEDEQIWSERFLELIHPDDIGTVNSKLKEIGNGIIEPFVIRWRHKAGHYVYVEHRNSVIRDKDDKIVVVIGIGRDMTERIHIEESLISSELFAQRLLEESANPVLVVNSDKTIRYTNQALLNITGFSLEEIMRSTDVRPWWPEDKIPEYRAMVGRDANREKVFRECLFRKKNGELFWVEVSVMNVIRNGKLDYVLLNWVDINEKKKYIDGLRESEAYNKALIMNAPNPVLVTNRDTSVRLVNQAFVKLTGYNQEDLSGVKVPYPWWPEEEVTKYTQEGEQGKAIGYVNRERRYRMKNDDYIWITHSLSHILDEENQVKYYISNWVDINERKKAEIALMNSEEKIRLLFASIADGLLITDMAGRIIDCNNNSMKITSFPKNMIIGYKVTDFILPDDSDKFNTAMQLLVNSGVFERLQIRMKNYNGGVFPIETNAALARDKDGTPLYVMVSFQDITERKKMEDRIIDLYEKEKKQRQELQEEAKQRGLFIDVLAHELRTPLTPILASTGMLKDLLEKNPDTLMQKLCSNIYAGGETLAYRLEELLDVARYSRGVFRLNKLPTDLNKFFIDVVARFEVTLDQRHQKLVTDISHQLPLAQIDTSRIEQVIVNLLSNASKFSQQNETIIFGVNYTNGILTMIVKDNGIGISAEDVTRLFQPYHRVEQDRQRFPGIGLGLAVSRQIVEAHGGNITVESQPEAGSTFIVKIPLEALDIKPA
jgi:two-component system NtrC family sensor kinase